MIGWVSPADWDWVAIGTILLAAATFSLAIYNRKIVVASQEQLETARQDLALAREQNETAREALEAQTAPVLASVPWGLDREVVWYNAATGEPASHRDASHVAVSLGTADNEPWVTISVPFRNVGNGVAVIASVQVMIGGRLFDGVPKTPILPPGEMSRAGIDVGRASVAFDHGASLAADGQDFAIVVGYADAAGNSRGAISLDVHRDAPTGDRWHVRQLHIGDTPEDALSHPSLSSLPL